MNEAENTNSLFNSVAIRVNLSGKEETYMQAENSEMDVYLEPIVEVEDELDFQSDQQVIICVSGC